MATETTEEVGGIWTGGRLNYKKSFSRNYPLMNWQKASAKKVVRAISASVTNLVDVDFRLEMPARAGWTWMNRTG